MAYTVVTSGDYYTWWRSLDEAEQIDIDAVIILLKEKGPLLGFPHSSGVNTLILHENVVLPTRRRAFDFRTLHGPTIAIILPYQQHFFIT